MIASLWFYQTLAKRLSQGFKVSAKLAYFLTHSDINFNDSTLRILSYQELKGVWNNNLYPIEFKSSKELSNIIDNIIINSRNGLHTLEAAHELGFGNRNYELINVDEKE